MVTRKTVKVTTKSSVLKFNPDWFTDPGPEFFKNLNKAQLRDLDKAKKDFGKRVNEILAKGSK